MDFPRTVQGAGSASEYDDDATGREDASRGRAEATIYDAAAGNIFGATRSDGHREPGVIKHSTGEMPLGPDEVLFRRRGAPERYAEHDVYYANERDLPRGGREALPDSDLLKAIHSYSSKFYASRAPTQGIRGERNMDERSMDETALLAFGILLEEAGREVLGRRGDLVLTEAAESSDAGDDDNGARKSSRSRVVVAGQREVRSQQSLPRKKRRRLVNKTETDEPSSPRSPNHETD